MITRLQIHLESDPRFAPRLPLRPALRDYEGHSKAKAARGRKDDELFLLSSFVSLATCPARRSHLNVNPTDDQVVISSTKEGILKLATKLQTVPLSTP